MKSVLIQPASSENCLNQTNTPLTLSAPSSPGSEVVVSVDLSSVEGLALDWVNKHLYYTDGSRGRITVTRLRSQVYQERRVILTGLGNPRDVVVDPGRG